MYEQDFESNAKSEILAFYKELNVNDGVLTAKDIIKLRKSALSLVPILNREKLPFIYNYISVMNRIKTNPKGYGITKSIEKYILFMLTVDPNFDAYIINETSNKKEEIYEKLINRFGLYDPLLIKVEKFYIDFFLGNTKKDQLKEKIASKII